MAKDSPLTIPGAERAKVYAVVALDARGALCVARAHVYTSEVNLCVQVAVREGAGGLG